MSELVPALVVEIEKLVAGGDGLARHEGRVVFVPGTVPGERHRVEVVDQKKDYWRARSVECLTPSPSRRVPPCPHYERCGGCSLMHLEPDAQLRAKEAILNESLSRVASRVPLVPARLLPSPETGYRSRLRFHIREVDGRLVLGFHPRRASSVVDVDRCLLGTERVNEALGRVRTALSARPALARGLDSVELQESGDGSGRVVARFVVRSGHALRRFDTASLRYLLEEAELHGLVVERPGRERGGRKGFAGSPLARHEVRRVRYLQSVESFFQVNPHLLEELVSAVVPERDVPRAIDLYCGVGLFSLPLSERANEVVGVESSSSAFRDAVENGKSFGADHLRFVHADAVRFASEFRFEPDDFVVVDPPRGGLPPPLRAVLARSPVRAIRYVSCDPPALARDAAVLAEHGFRIDSLVLLDFFPNTHHFETVARLTRGPLDSRPAAG